jgi:TPR repeat protein
LESWSYNKYQEEKVKFKIQEVSPLLQNIQEAESNDASALSKLAWKYWHGEGVRKSYRKAFELYHKSAKLGHVTAQYNLNLFYLFVPGIDHNDKKAFYWAKKAACADDSDAILAIGWHYHNGYGVKKDIKKAEYWYLRAASLKEVSAYFSLGQLYYDKKSYKQAIPWFRKGIKEHHKKSLYYLGRMYLEGKGVQTDYTKAEALLKDSVTQGYYLAKRLLQSKRIKRIIKSKG